MVYHGTTKKSANEIIKSQNMNPSRGIRHWLGDGVYFYKEEFYAIKWIVQMQKNNKMGDNDTLGNYTILKAELNINADRIFSFFNFNHMDIFNHAKEEFLKEEKKRKREYSDFTNLDGAVLNFMFNNLRYADMYDLIIASFVHEDKTSKQESRLCYKHEIQICVKNNNIITNIKELENVSEKISEKNFYIINDYSKYNSGVLTRRNIAYNKNKFKK